MYKAISTGGELVISDDSDTLFWDEISNNYLMYNEAQLIVSKDVIDEAQSYVKNGLPHQYCNDDELQMFVADYSSVRNFDLERFKALQVHNQEQLEYDQAVVLAFLDILIKQNEGNNMMSTNKNTKTQSLRERQEQCGSTMEGMNHVHTGVRSGVSHNQPIYPQPQMLNHPFYPQPQLVNQPYQSIYPPVHGKVMDSVELFLSMAQKDDKDVMATPLKFIVDASLTQCAYQKHTLRRNGVVFIRNQLMSSMIISLPSGEELEFGAMDTVSQIMMIMAHARYSEDDFTAFAEAIDLLTSELTASDDANNVS